MSGNYFASLEKSQTELLGFKFQRQLKRIIRDLIEKVKQRSPLVNQLISFISPTTLVMVCLASPKSIRQLGYPKSSFSIPA